MLNFYIKEINTYCHWSKSNHVYVHSQSARLFFLYGCVKTVSFLCYHLLQIMARAHYMFSVYINSSITYRCTWNFEWIHQIHKTRKWILYKETTTHQQIQRILWWARQMFRFHVEFGLKKKWNCVSRDENENAGIIKIFQLKSIRTLLCFVGEKSVVVEVVVCSGRRKYEKTSFTILLDTLNPIISSRHT